MPQTQRSHVQHVKLRCRFETKAADALSSNEFCVFEFPGCEGCPKAQHTVPTVGSSEDPMKSEALRAWAAGASRPKTEFSEKYDAEREVLSKLLAHAETKEPPPKNGILKPR